MLTIKQLKELEKRTNNKKLREWKKQVKERDGFKCVICQETKFLNAHHLVPQELKELRYEVDNGISLCPKHHKWDKIISAHKNPLIFDLWFRYFHKEQYDRLMKLFYSFGFNQVKGGLPDTL